MIDFYGLTKKKAISKLKLHLYQRDVCGTEIYTGHGEDGQFYYCYTIDNIASTDGFYTLTVEMYDKSQGDDCLRSVKQLYKLEDK